MKRHDKEIKARDTHIAQFQQEMHVVGLLFVEGDDVGEMLRRFSKVSRLPKSWLQGNWIVGKCLGGVLAANVARLISLRIANQ